MKEPLFDIQHYPIANLILIATVGISLLAFRYRTLMGKWMLQPFRIVHEKKPESVLTYGFIHADIMHLLFNMVSLYSIAFPLEAVMGPLRFGLVYCGSLLLGAVPAIIRQKNNPTYRALGASGAVSGMFFSGMLFFPQGKIHLFFLPIGIPYPIFAVLFLLFSLYAAKRGRGNIGHDAHIAGALAGLLLTLVLVPESFGLFIAGLRGSP